MKVVIMAGGVGSRLSEETVLKPKPMVEVGGRPIMWHIMKHYAHYGHDHFVVALGYKGEVIKRYMVEYASLSSSLEVKLGSGGIKRLDGDGSELDWTLSLIDTGLPTLTAGRLKRCLPHIGKERFFMTWGDGVSNVDLDALLAFHESHGKVATVTAVRPPSRFGLLEIDGDVVASFTEKPQLGEGWINGAFFVVEPEIADYLPENADEWSLETSALVALADDGQLAAYKHDGFWQCMDTLRDKVRLEKMWNSGDAPWKIWED